MFKTKAGRQHHTLFVVADVGADLDVPRLGRHQLRLLAGRRLHKGLRWPRLPELHAALCDGEADGHRQGPPPPPPMEVLRQRRRAPGARGVDEHAARAPAFVEEDAVAIGMFGQACRHQQCLERLLGTELAGHAIQLQRGPRVPPTGKVDPAHLGEPEVRPVPRRPLRLLGGGLQLRLILHLARGPGALRDQTEDCLGVEQLRRHGAPSLEHGQPSLHRSGHVEAVAEELVCCSLGRPGVEKIQDELAEIAFDDLPDLCEHPRLQMEAAVGDDHVVAIPRLHGAAPLQGLEGGTRVPNVVVANHDKGRVTRWHLQARDVPKESQLLEGLQHGNCNAASLRLGEVDTQGVGHRELTLHHCELLFKANNALG
mmetsp:Transcript_89040/g.232149  ORF Transcript_89040/g.232149 Transcript_89040/m.232149 type:complete len:370 (+) Transcript_89040:584-1693(+)